MEFYAINGKKRPIRLSEETRRFAHESLNRKYGLETLSHRAVDLDSVNGYENLSMLEKYDVAIQTIVREAPLRICQGELISGAATLGAVELDSVDGVELIPYHAYGGSKATLLGLADNGRKEWIPTDGQMAQAKEILLEQGISVI